MRFADFLGFDYPNLIRNRVPLNLYFSDTDGVPEQAIAIFYLLVLDNDRVFPSVNVMIGCNVDRVVLDVMEILVVM